MVGKENPARLKGVYPSKTARLGLSNTHNLTMPLFESYKWRRRRTRYLFFFVVSLLAFPCLVVSGAIRQRYHEDLKDEKANELQNINFLDWVEDTLNINTELVTIENFEYLDYIQAMKDGVDIFYDEEVQYYQSFIRGNDAFDYGGDGYYYDDDEDYFDEEEDEEDEDQFLSVTDYPTITTRGLAASRDIVVGEVILKVPHDALWTVSNTIDKDPILSKVMGTDIRRKYGWNSTMDEIPLLAVALLYHYQLNNDHNIYDLEESEPLDEYDDDVTLLSMLQDTVSYAPYLKLMQDTNLAERIPHLWDSKTLRQAATIGVRRVAKGIQKDVKELYERIMLPLIQDNPDVFGNPFYKQKPPKDLMELSDQQKIQHPSDGAKELEWMFSLEKFRWAFALVNSRHWQLPIPEEGYGDTDDADAFHASSNMQFDESASPPASMPTDEWMDLQKELDFLRDEDKNVGEESIELTMGNSFLAPVADLMNFGPPCTRGLYNTTTHTFDILATCNIAKGQEITFWYGDACQGKFHYDSESSLLTIFLTHS